MSDRYNQPPRGSYDGTWDVPYNENFFNIGADVDALEAGKADKDGAGTGTLTNYQAINTETADITGRLNDVRFVTSAAEMNAALNDLSATGGTVRWLPGNYDGSDFTEQVVIPADIPHTTLDMRNVNIKISSTDFTYLGENGSFFYKPAGLDSSKPLNILGPHEFRIGAGEIRDVVPRPHVMELWDTESCRIAPHIVATDADRLLYMRQQNSSGHHVKTWGAVLYGGNVGIQWGDSADPLGKDRGHIWGQIEGYKDAGVLLEKGLNNRVWAQVEKPSSSAGPDASGHRIVSGQNSLMLTHRSSTGHGTDIRANNCGIFDSGSIGSGGTFENERLGVRPSNIYIPNYRSSAYDFSTDWRPVLSVVEEGTSTVGYDAARGEVTLKGEGGGTGNAAIVQTSGPAGLMGQFFHAYANMHIGGSDGALGSKIVKFGAYVDAGNYAMLKYDASASTVNTSRPLGVEIVVGGVEQKNTFFDITASTSPEGWIVYLNDTYQVFMADYGIVDETAFDLSTWPGDPKLRVEEELIGSTGGTVNVRALEHGMSQKWESQNY